jgi:hypothetical protein
MVVEQMEQMASEEAEAEEVTVMEIPAEMVEMAL